MEQLQGLLGCHLLGLQEEDHPGTFLDFHHHHLLLHRLNQDHHLLYGMVGIKTQSVRDLLLPKRMMKKRPSGDAHAKKDANVENDNCKKNDEYSANGTSVKTGCIQSEEICGGQLISMWSIRWMDLQDRYRLLIEFFKS